MPRRHRNQADFDLICVGEYYNDLIFHGLARVPRLGQETNVKNFSWAPGGGAAITAITARRLGLRVGLVTVAGQPEELANIRGQKIDTSMSCVDPQQRI